MSENNDSKRIPTVDFQYEVAADGRSATLRLKENDSEVFVRAMDAVSVEALIAGLGEVRGKMLEPVSNDLNFQQSYPLAAFNPRWYVVPDSTNKFATFWIRHPGLGWSGFGFPRHEAANIAKWLRKVIPIKATRDTQSPAATSVGSDDFFISTEGLGFYYYGKDEKRIGPHPFEQIEFDSDRAAGLVAGSIAERRLEQALMSRLRTDKPDIARDLFRPSGALGPFSTKISFAYMMGILSDQAHRDLVTLKNIRNDFAHDLELDSFDVPSIKDRCKNLVLIDKHIGPIPTQPVDGRSATSRSEGAFYLGLPDHEHKLADPRFRYIMTSQIISFSLGMASDNPSASLPFV
jgi:hypothetical protein